jgi:hypothetical protein
MEAGGPPVLFFFSNPPVLFKKPAVMKLLSPLVWISPLDRVKSGGDEALVIVGFVVVIFASNNLYDITCLFI